MFKLVGLQIITILGLAAIAYGIADLESAYSLALGGLCYALPTLLAVLFLKFLQPYPALAGVGFLVSEGLKIVLAIILMVVVVVNYPALKFLPFIVGLLFASHIIFLLFLKVFRYGK